MFSPSSGIVEIVNNLEGECWNSYKDWSEIYFFPALELSIDFVKGQELLCNYKELQVFFFCKLLEFW